MALTQVKTLGIADDAVTLAKQAGGTDGQIITYDASGNPTTVGPGSDGQVLTSTGAGSPPAFETLPTSGAALTGSTDNTICTVTGANAIQGEASLTYDGSDLNISNNVPQLLLTDTNSNNSQGRVRGNGGNLILSADTNDATGSSVINFEIDGAEKARIDSSGKVLIGTTTAGLVDTADNLTIEDSATGGITIRSGSTSYGNLFFADSSSGAGSYAGYVQYKHNGDELRLGVASNDRLTMDGSGDITIPNGNLKVASGHGIDFSANSHAGGMTSELLDAYEEGTYSPEGLSWNGSSWVNVNFDAISRYGRYTRVGKLCHVTGYLSAFHVNSAFDNTLAGVSLPFTSINASGSHGVGYTTHSTGFASAGYTTFFTQPNTAHMYSIKENDDTYNTWATTSGKYIMFNVTYIVE